MPWRLWLYYPLFWLGIKRLGSFKDATSVFVFAYGRNTLEDCNLGWIGRQRQLLATDRDMVQWIRQQRFDGQPFDPGWINAEIARSVRTSMFGAPRYSYVQWEVAMAFDPDWYEAHRRRIEILWPPADCPDGFRTRDVLLEIKQRFGGREGSTVAIFAHQGMIVRAAYLAKQMLGVEPVIPEQDVSGFEEHSVQPNTRNHLAWLWYEFRVRVHHVLHRWVDWPWQPRVS